MTELWSDVNQTKVAIASGSLTRNGTFVIPAVTLSTYGDSNTFHALTHVYDGKGIEQDMWPSGDIAASCV